MQVSEILERLQQKLEPTDEEIAILATEQQRALNELTDEEIAILTNDTTRMVLSFQEISGKEFSPSHRAVQYISELMSSSSYPRTPKTNTSGAELGEVLANYENDIVRTFGKLAVSTQKVDYAMLNQTPIDPKALQVLRKVYAAHQNPRYICSFPKYIQDQYQLWGTDVANYVFTNATLPST
jgi:hypothetical protein